jgi:hypothetical protein
MLTDRPSDRMPVHRVFNAFVVLGLIAIVLIWLLFIMPSGDGNG